MVWTVAIRWGPCGVGGVSKKLHILPVWVGAVVWGMRVVGGPNKSH